MGFWGDFGVQGFGVLGFGGFCVVGLWALGLWGFLGLGVSELWWVRVEGPLGWLSWRFSTQRHRVIATPDLRGILHLNHQ